MGDQRTLKFKGEADFRDVRKEADETAARLDNMAASAQRFFRSSPNLASDPASFMADKVSYSSENKATGPKIFSQTTVEYERLANAQLKIRAISRVLGIDGIGIEILRLRELVSVVSQLGAIGTGALAAGAGAAAGIGAVAYGFFQMKETRRLNGAIQGSQTGNNAEVLNRLRGVVSEGRTSGAFRGGTAEDLDQTILTLLRQNGVASRSSSFAGGIIASGVQSKLPELMQQIKAAVVATYKTEEEAARDHAHVLAEIAQTQFDTEKSQLRQKLELGLITNDRYAARLRGIAEEEAKNQLAGLDLQEKQLNEHLDRSKDDVEESARTRNALSGVADKRSLIGARLTGQQEQIEIDRVSRMSKTNAGYRMPGDELSKIGLFVGGSGDSLPELSKQQLAELKQLGALLRGLPSQISGAF